MTKDLEVWIGFQIGEREACQVKWEKGAMDHDLLERKICFILGVEQGFDQP